MSIPDFSFYADTIRREMGRELFPKLLPSELDDAEDRAVRKSGRVISQLKNWRHMESGSRQLALWSLGFGANKGVRVLRELLPKLSVVDKLVSLTAAVMGVFGHLDDELLAHLTEYGMLWGKPPPLLDGRLPNGREEEWVNRERLGRVIRVAKQLHYNARSAGPFVMHRVSNPFRWVGSLPREGRDSDPYDLCEWCRSFLDWRQDIPLFVRARPFRIPEGYVTCEVRRPEYRSDAG